MSKRTIELSDDEIRVIKKWSESCPRDEDMGCCDDCDGPCEWAEDDGRGPIEPDPDLACEKLWNKIDRLYKEVEK